MSFKKKETLLSKAQKSLTHWSGLDLAICLLRDLSKTPHNIYGEEIHLYQDNLAQEKTLLNQPFKAVLEHWGINSDQELKAYQRQKKLELVAGFALCLLAIISLFRYVPSQTLSAWLICLADLSIALLGLVFILTSSWRLKCLKRKRFLPFGLWLKNLGSF